MRIVGMQINDILILADNNFGSNKEETIKVAKLMTKNRKQLTPAQPIKFNGAQIKLNSNGKVLTKESHVGGILPVKGHDVDSINLRGITRKKLSLKERYLA